MIPNDLLIVCIEVAVSFAGFAGIIATFQLGDESKIRRGDVVGLAMIVQNSLTCAISAALPLVLATFLLAESTIWTVASVMGVMQFILFMYLIDKNMRGAVTKKSDKLFFGSLQVAAAMIVLLLILNAVGVVFHHEAGPYIVAVIFVLMLVGYMFTRLLLRPLWLTLRAQKRVQRSEPA